MPGHEFEFVGELPFKAYQHRVPGSLMREFAQALRSRPGMWAKWPTSLHASTCGGYTTKIRNGAFLAFREGFDATSRNGVLYVRYVGGVSSDE